MPHKRCYPCLLFMEKIFFIFLSMLFLSRKGVTIMAQFNLTAEEVQELLKILKKEVSRLEIEIIHTDTSEFRKFLQALKSVKEKLIEKSEK